MSAGFADSLIGVIEGFDRDIPALPSMPSAPIGNIPTDGLVLVKNDSGSDQLQFAVLGIDDAMITPTDNLGEFKSRPMFSVVTPNVPLQTSPQPHESDHRNRFVVLFEPIAAGKIGRAWSSCACPVQVNTTLDLDYKTALPVDAQTGYLEASDFGSVPLLWRESGTGLKWALINMSPEAQMISGLTLTQGDPVSGDPLWREIWAVVPTVMDRTGYPATGEEANLAGGLRPDAADMTFNVGFASRTVFPVVTDYAGNTYPLAPDMRTCNHFTDAYSSVSALLETFSGPIAFTEQAPTCGTPTTDNWQAPDCSLPVWGRMMWDAANNAWRPGHINYCDDMALLLGEVAHDASYQSADGLVLGYVIAELIALNTLIDVALINCGCAATGYTPAPGPALNYVPFCDNGGAGCTGGWSSSIDVPSCS